MTRRPTSTPSADRPAPAHRLRAAAVGLAAGWALLGMIAVLVMAFGLFDVRATTPHQRIVARLIHATMIQSVHRRSGRFVPPPGFTPAEVEAGFRIYDSRCAMCHGGPGLPRADWVSGLTPDPPFLVDAARRWRPQDLRLIIGNGVKMTAMPAWQGVLRDGDIWDVVAFLEALPDLSAADYARMRAAQRQPASGARPPRS